MLREIVFDTETTGVRANDGDRLVEIGCVELLNHIPTGNTFHVYINPERPVPVEAFDIHGLSDEFLADKPVFAEIADKFWEFIGDSKLIAHNASFDIGFMNAEYARIDKSRQISMERVIDTLALARRKHPGAGNSLDALCSRYGIDNSRRTKHGALLDSEILAEVYLELIGGRQAGFNLADEPAKVTNEQNSAQAAGVMPREKRVFKPRMTDHELMAHRAFIAKMGDKAIWKDYMPEEPSETA
ncbi:DNA polymerase III subunit epsilon [Microvirga sp. W0021]|uniref:DNA polymerase III subunit epsilon n=1 Tax=Hohaiivirga grylli TaxID=3133970 RepID=A0ABV0BF81_9HYPH